MPLKVYYLDDEEDLCDNFVDYFASEDVHVTTFDDPKMAIEAILKYPPDLLFIDYRLPGTTGDEVAKALDPKIPKLLITGDISVKTEYPFIKVISKPYSEHELAQFIDSFVIKSRLKLCRVG